MKEEGDLKWKAEFPSYLDPSAPPICRNINSDKNLQPVIVEELRWVAQAFKRLNRPGFQLLGQRIRDKILAEGVPWELLGANGAVFLKEDLADNALVYPTPQFLRKGKREDGWHTDGAASVLHAAWTLFGEGSAD